MRHSCKVFCPQSFLSYYYHPTWPYEYFSGCLGRRLELSCGVVICGRQNLRSRYGNSPLPEPIANILDDTETQGDARVGLLDEPYHSQDGAFAPKLRSSRESSSRCLTRRGIPVEAQSKKVIYCCRGRGLYWMYRKMMGKLYLVSDQTLQTASDTHP